MRVLVTIILYVLCGIYAMAQNKLENIYTFDDKGEIVVNEKFVETYVEKNESEVKPYELIGISTFEAHSKKYELHVLEYKGWEEEAGDFRIIRLFHNNEHILEFIDEEGWIGDSLFTEGQTWLSRKSLEDIRSRGRVFEDFAHRVSEHAKYTGHCIVYPLENEAAALLFEGFCYGSQPYVFTIIVIKDGKARVVFNQSWFVSVFEPHENGFSITLENDCCTPNTIGRICTTQDGGMTFKTEPFVEDTTVYLQPDRLPLFNKSPEALKGYLKENVRYPDLSKKQGIQGRVIVQFVVNADGSISDAKVIKSVHPHLDKEALRVVNAMPSWRWEPGIKDGKRVRVQFALPITFKLNNPLREKAINMLKEFYADYVFGLKPFQLDATKYCTSRFLSKLGDDYEAQLKEDYIVSQEEVGLEWWSFYNFINGYQDGPNEIDEVTKVVHEHDNTYRIYFIECGYENHRLVDLVERNDSLFIDDVYRLKYDSNGEVRY